MEVMHHHKEETQVEIMEEAQVEIMAEEPLERRKTRHPDHNIKGFHSDQEPEKNRISENSNIYFDDMNGENVKVEGLDLLKLVNAVINNQSAGNDLEDTVVSGLNASTFGQTSREGENSRVGATEKGRTGIVKESGDEVLELEFEEEIELEFERAVEKVHTHTAYCPHCKKRITKVVLRRRKGDSKPGEKPLDRDSKPGEKPLDRDSKPGEKQLDLFGCLSCFSIFIPPGNCLNLSGIFGDKEKGKGKDQLGPKIPVSTGSCTPGDSPGTNGIKSLEILKCIVYGGLVESLTSLSVVSSAAASDAKTLNIIVLGLASVIGGLFVIAQNLVDLKNEVSGGSPDQETHRYQELLGRRTHFPLHATVAILSFLVFGLIPPVVYGFTFRVSDNKDYKILAVAASSLASIIILATAKTYTKRPEKFNAYIKTILYCCTMAFAVSGVSYAAGDLIKILMQKLDWFEPSPGAGAGAGAASSLISNMNPPTPAWAYY